MLEHLTCVISYYSCPPFCRRAKLLIVMRHILDRYLLKEILPYILLGLILLTSMIFAYQASRFSELFIVFARRGLSSSPILKLMASLLPGILVFTLPISMLLGILIGLSRMSGDSEIIALRASGIGRARILQPIIILALIITALTAYITFKWLPGSARQLSELKETRQVLLQGIATQVKPRVFEESFPNKVLYVQNIDRNTEEWGLIFVALLDPNKEPVIVTAQRGVLNLKATAKESELHLFDGVRHEIPEKEKLRYNVEQFGRLYVGFDTGISPEQNTSSTNNQLHPSEMNMAQLLNPAPDTKAEDQRKMRVELHKRFALPAACLVFALLGVSLGISPSRHGRSFGMLLGIGVTFSYYLVFAGGENAARSGVLPPFVGIWGANTLLALLGAYLLYRQRYVTSTTSFKFLIVLRAQILRAILRAPDARSSCILKTARMRISRDSDLESQAKINVTRFAGRAKPGRRIVAWGFPRIIDRYILSDLMRFFSIVVAGLTGLFIIFTLFELINSIVKNNIDYLTVVDYFVFLTPQIISYMTPMALLVAVLITFGAMAKSSQIVALLASGQSIYRLGVPVLIISTLLSALMFLLQEHVLPFTNRRQDDLRAYIKQGQEPAQTFYQVGSSWVFGGANQSRIYFHQHFDARTNQFAGISVYDLDPKTFSVTRRIYASRAYWDPGAQDWVFQNGWVKTFDSSRVLSSESFSSKSFQLPDPPDYFKRSNRGEASKLTTAELIQHIRDLSQSGFDVLELRISLYGKFAFPLTCLIMAVVSLPFAFTVGKRGALHGVGVSIFIGIIYWGMLGFFQQMGRYEILPPLLAAWGPNLLFGSSGVYLFFTSRT